jgi:uncharacterized membrane protein
MEVIGLLFLLAFVVLVFVLPIRAAIVSRAARDKTAQLEEQLRQAISRLTDQQYQMNRRIGELEGQLRDGATPSVKADQAAAPPVSPELQIVSQPSTAPPTPPQEQVSPEPVLAETLEPFPVPAAAEEAVPAPLAPPPLPPASTLAPVSARESTTPVMPPPMPPPMPLPAAARKPVQEKPAFTLEQFMGVKLFAWLGGLALFLGIVFFVKYAFEQNLIPPSVRTAIGFVLGIGLTVGGLKLSAKKTYTVLAHTLSATGVLVLYGVTFAAHSIYKFKQFDSVTTFGVMTLITAVGFLLAVRMNAMVVAVLGMVGGFLTPILCSTGQDNPWGLFGYITLLDLGLIAVAKKKRWLYLTALGAAGTILMQLGWDTKFFAAEGYMYGPKTWITVGVFLWFAFLFTAGAWWSKRRDGEDLYPVGSALALCGSALIIAFSFFDHTEILQRPGLLYTLVLLVNVAVLATVWIEPRVRAAQAIVGLLTFTHLSIWSTHELTAEMLPAALAIYLVFGFMHTAFSVVWARRHPGTPQTIAGFVPVVALLLMILPVLRLPAVPFLLWPALLLVNLLIIGLAVVTRALLPVLTAIVLTLFTTLAWLLRLPATTGSMPGFLTILCGFAVVFIAASCFLSRRILATQPNQIGDRDLLPNSLAEWLPISSATLPFLLLIMASLHIPMPNPAPVFGAALVLTLFMLGLTRVSGIGSLPPVAMLCSLGLQISWHVHRFDISSPWQPLFWYLGFYLLFTLYPFIFRKVFERAILPWAAAALSGVGAFLLVHDLVRITWPNNVMGLLPAAFAVAPLLSLVMVLKRHDAANPARLSQLAWYGAVGLFFITLIFPIQFDRQWITLGWAFEGAALCWLYRRVPHGGLRATGAGLLIAAFVRLALNPAVLTYYPRSETPILNWHLYTYGLAAAALILAAWWLAPPRHKLGDINLRSLFCALGGVLLFLLLNIEIADYFTAPGQRFIVFNFDGNFGRDMTTSISWGLFALGLLGLGFWLRTAATRYAGIGLLAITLLKLFFHDLANIGSIYRIGALIIVALIALAASFLYQKFLDRSHPTDEA